MLIYQHYLSLNTLSLSLLNQTILLSINSEANKLQMSYIQANTSESFLYLDSIF